MIRLALSWMALQMVGRIPNWPKADAVEVDMETGNTVLDLYANLSERTYQATKEE